MKAYSCVKAYMESRSSTGPLFNLYFNLMTGVILFYSGLCHVFHFFAHPPDKGGYELHFDTASIIFFFIFDNADWSNYTADLLIM